MINFLKSKGQAETSLHHVNKFSRAINFCLYFLAFAVPVIFSSLTYETREFNKQGLVFLVVLLALGIWLVKNLVDRKFSWTKTVLDYVLFVYLAIYGIASLLSVDRVSSFMGYYVRFTGSLMSLAAFILLYFLIVQNVRTAKVTRTIVNALAAGFGIVLVYSLLQLFGKYILPFAFTKNQSFNPIGSLSALAIFSGISIIYYLWMLMNINRNPWRSYALGFLIIVALAVMLLVNSFVAWLVLALSLIAMMAITMSVTEKELFQSWFWKPMLVLVVAILFVSFQFLPRMVNPRGLIKLDLPTEVQLSSKATWGLVKSSMSGNVKNTALGTGPGTLGVEFGKLKPVDLNKTIIWNLNFDRASTEIANKLIETGIFGTAAFEFVGILFLIYALQYLFRKGGDKGYFYALGFFGIWLPLYISHFFYFSNGTFDFLFWLSLGMFMAVSSWSHLEENEYHVPMHSSIATMATMFASLLLLAGILLGIFWQATLWTADITYTSALQKMSKPNPDFTQIGILLSRAKDLNPYRDNYQLAYGQDLFYLASEESAKKPADVAKIQALVANMIAAGQKATVLSPNKASNWSALAQYYTNIRSLATGTDTFIISSWQKAIDLDPKNPILYADIAQALINSSESIDPRILGTGPDTDHDGLSDAMETKFGSDPKKYDTNGNGIADGDEVKSALDPVGVGALSESVISPYRKIDTSKLDLAEENSRKAIDLKEDLPDPYIQLARIFEKTDRLGEAKSQLDIAAGIFPNNPDVLFEQAFVTFNQQKYDEAEKILNQVVLLSPNHANAFFTLGKISELRGDLAKALAYYEKVRLISGPNVGLEQLIAGIKLKQAPPTK